MAIQTRWLALLLKSGAAIVGGALAIGGGTYGYQALGEIRERQAEHEVRIATSEKAMGHAAKLLESLVERTARIEETRFTREDGKQLAADLKAWTSEEFPPQHLLEKIDRNHQETLREIGRVGKIAEGLDQRLRAHERRESSAPP